MKNLTPRELATVLAALRYFQRECTYHDKNTGAHFENPPMYLADYFAEEVPLTELEIDALCEELNVAGPEEWYGMTREDVVRNARDLETDNCETFDDEEIDGVWAEWTDYTREFLSTVAANEWMQEELLKLREEVA